MHLDYFWRKDSQKQNFPTNVYFHQIYFLAISPYSQSCILLTTVNTKHFIFLNSFIIFKTKVVLYFYIVKSGDLGGFVSHLGNVLPIPCLSSNFPQILITLIRIGKVGTYWYCDYHWVTGRGEKGRRWLQEMRKWQPHEIQVSLQDQLVHHDLMTGEIFLSSSFLIVLNFLATLKVMNKGL